MDTGCFAEIRHSGSLTERHWTQKGDTTVRMTLPPANGHDLYVRVFEEGVDVEIAFADPNGAAKLSDSPVERYATQQSYFPAGASVPRSLVVRSKEPAAAIGTVALYVTRLPRADNSHPNRPLACAAAIRHWAAADMAYAKGRSVELGVEPIGMATARTAFEEAAGHYQMALTELPAAGAEHERGALLLSMAAIAYYELHDWSGAAASAQKAAEVFVRLEDVYQRARAQALLAAAWMEVATKSSAPGQGTITPRDSRARLDDARALLQQVATFHARRGEVYDETLQINNIGLAYYYEARFEEGIPYFRKSRVAFEKLGERSRAALALQNLALCEWGLGHLSAALAMFDRALEWMSPTEYPDLYLLTLNNSGLAHYAAGRFDDSLQLQTRALEFATRSQADRARARSYYGMAVTYYAIGDRDLALRLLHSALDICAAELDARVRVATLRALAVIEDETGLRQEAVAHNSEALTIAAAPSARARILLQLAREYSQQGRGPEAFSILSGLIDSPPNQDGEIQGIALLRRGAALRAAGQLSAAEADLTRSLRLLIRFDALTERFEAGVELARVRVDQQRYADALVEVERALRLSPEMRAQTANPEYRASLSQVLRPALELELDLLWQRYQESSRAGDSQSAHQTAVQALQLVDDSRAQGFDQWRSERLDPRNDERTRMLLADSAALYQKMAESRFQLSAREDRAGADDPRARILREDIAQMRARVGVVNAELAARTSRAGGGTLLQKAVRFEGLPAGQTAIEYWLGPNHAFAWTVNNSAVMWVSLGPAGPIEQAARTLHESMRSFAGASLSARLAACDQMYQLLIAPIEASLSRTTDLVIVPDGPLHYVPFAALRPKAVSNTAYLVQRYSISIAPALRLMSAGAGPSASKKAASFSKQQRGLRRVLIVADPVYSADDSRVPQAFAAAAATQPATEYPLALRGVSERVGSAKLQRLSASGREAKQIQALYQPGEVEVLEGLQATRDNFLSRDLSGYEFIHVASHGLIDSEIPQLSALILGTYGPQGPIRDSYVRAGDLLARTFNARVVVLSACDSALGREFPSEGIVGLRYAALARGAHAVVASLWPVGDGMAADLMTYMYESMTSTARDGGRDAVTSGLAVAASLAAAMRQVLQQSPALDPALWAPFTAYVAGD